MQMINKYIMQVWITLFFITILISCEKNAIIERAATPAGAKVMFVHNVPDGPQFNFYINNIKITGGLTNAPSKANGLAYSTTGLSNVFGYANIGPGAAEIKAIVPESSTTVAPGTTVLTANTTMEDGKFYSVFATDVFAAISSLIIEDVLVNETGKAGMRFVNLASGSPNVDVYDTYTANVTGATPVTTLFASNIPFKTATEFKVLEPGRHSFQMTLTGTATAVGNALVFINLADKSNYTLFSRGIVTVPNATSPALTSYNHRN